MFQCFQRWIRAEEGGSVAQAHVPSPQQVSFYQGVSRQLLCRAVSANVKDSRQPQDARSVAWETSLVFPIINDVSVGAVFIVITPVSTAASGSCCGRRKGGCPYGELIIPKVPRRSGRSLQMSVVGHLRPDFVSAKSMGIVAFISRSRNKTLIPGNSVCSALYAVSQMCTGYCEKHGVICCCHPLPQNNGTEARVDLQEGRLGPLF